MWYVIQTKTGEEENLLLMINVFVDKDTYSECFIPKYENVWVKQGKANVSVEKMFNGYIFVDTENPEKLYEELRKVPVYANLISDRNEKEYQFVAMAEEERKFYDRILGRERVMRLTYLRRGKDKRADKAVGPMAEYMSNITKVDWHHRRAFAKVMLLGEERSIRFGITLEEPELKDEDWWNWKNRKEQNGKKTEASERHTLKDININPGEKICMTEGIYSGREYEVVNVDGKRRKLTVAVPICGTVMMMEVGMDEVHYDTKITKIIQ